MKILVFYVDKQYFNMVTLFLRLRVRRELIIRRDGRAVEGTGLENRRCESIRGFESHSLRQLNFSIDLRKYPRGRRGSPAKGVGRVKSAAEVQILSSAPKGGNNLDILSAALRIPKGCRLFLFQILHSGKKIFSRYFGNWGDSNSPFHRFKGKILRSALFAVAE